MAVAPTLHTNINNSLPKSGEISEKSKETVSRDKLFQTGNKTSKF
jgi:hypothetical protein